MPVYILRNRKDDVAVLVHKQQSIVTWLQKATHPRIHDAGTHSSKSCKRTREVALDAFVEHLKELVGESSLEGSDVGIRRVVYRDLDRRKQDIGVRSGGDSEFE